MDTPTFDRNVFDTTDMAAGYARSRPPVHPRVIERIRKRLGLDRPLARALDIGCGTGLSTAPLERIAERLTGVEPSEAMVSWGPKLAPGAGFTVGAAEALPIRSATIDIITAAGSLNWADLTRFFPEANRVLRPGGHLVIYDFGPATGLRGSDALDSWYAEFRRRYPFPPARELGPENLRPQPYGFEVTAHDDFEIGICLDPAAYLDYVMTETNVATAVANGAAEAGIRAWCESTLAPIFDGTPREVLFTGYIFYAVKA